MNYDQRCIHMRYDDERIQTSGGRDYGEPVPRRSPQGAQGTRSKSASAPDYERRSISYDEYMARQAQRNGDYDGEYDNDYDDEYSTRTASDRKSVV